MVWINEFCACYLAPGVPEVFVTIIQKNRIPITRKRYHKDTSVLSINCGTVEIQYWHHLSSQIFFVVVDDDDFFRSRKSFLPLVVKEKCAKLTQFIHNKYLYASCTLKRKRRTVR